MRYITIILLFFSIYASAQTKTFIGVKGGGGISSAYFEYTLANALINTEYIPSYHGGVIVRFFSRINRSSYVNGGLQSGVTLTKKGWKQVFPTEEPSYVTQLTYLEFPLEAMIYGGRGKTKPYFTLGMNFGHLVKVDKDPDPDLENIGQAEFYPYEESRDRTFSYGLRAGFGLQREFSFGAIHLEGYATYSMRDMLEYGSFDSGIPDLSNSYVMGFSVAYMIGFGKLDF